MEGLGPLFTLFCGVIAGGEGMFRGTAGLFCALASDCFRNLTEDVADLSGGTVFVPMLASSAALFLANAASDLLLLLVVSPDDEAEYW